METKVFLDRYRLSLGRNGLPVELQRTPRGTCYRAQEIGSGREVAIELIPILRPDAATVDRVEAEATAARQIHQINIPLLYDFGIENEQLIYVTEYLEGPTAESWVAARGPLPLPAVLRIAIQVVAALGAAKFHRIHHRAINPANILFVPGQTAEGDWPAIKVLHWLGLPTGDGADESGDARADAAARFLSPEQVGGGEIDFASAVYSLGATMWFLLTGVAPALTPALTGAVTLPVEKLRGVPKIVRHLLGRMLRVNPAERPQDPVALEAYLQTCLARVERRGAVKRRMGIPLVARTRVVKERVVRDWPLRPLAIAAALLLCATLAALALPRLLRTRERAQASADVSPTETIGVDQAVEETEAQATPVPAPPVSVPQPAVEQPAIAQNSTMESLPPAEGPAANEMETTPITATQAAPTPAVAVVARATPPPEVVAATEQTVEPAAELEPTPVVIAKAEPSTQTLTEPEPSPAVVAQAEPPPETGTIIPPSDTPPEYEGNLSLPPRPSPAAKKLEVAAKAPAQKKTNRHRTVAKTARAESHKTKRIAHHTVRRGRKIPSLHFGSKRAELVGTTSDGHWILSVASSGRRVVVPPPPGFEP